MSKKSIFHAGQKVLMQGRRPGEDEEVTVSRVARKYVYVEKERFGRVTELEYRFDLASGWESTQHPWRKRIVTPELLAAETARSDAFARIKKTYHRIERERGFGKVDLTTDQLHRIASILEEKTIE